MIKEEYYNYSVTVRGKRLYFADMNNKELTYWKENGFSWLFETEIETETDKDNQIDMNGDGEIDSHDIVLQYLNEKIKPEDDIN